MILTFWSQDFNFEQEPPPQKKPTCKMVREGAFSCGKIHIRIVTNNVCVPWDWGLVYGKVGISGQRSVFSHHYLWHVLLELPCLCSGRSCSFSITFPYKNSLICGNEGSLIY